MQYNSMIFRPPPFCVARTERASDMIFKLLMLVWTGGVMGGGVDGRDRQQTPH